MSITHVSTTVDLTRYAFSRFARQKTSEINPRDVFALLYKTLDEREDINEVSEADNTLYHFVLHTYDELVQLNRHLLTRPGMNTDTPCKYYCPEGIIGIEVAKTHRKESKIESILFSALKQENWEKVLRERSSSTLYMEFPLFTGITSIKQVEESSTTNWKSRRNTYASRLTHLSELYQHQRTPQIIKEVLRYNGTK